jgi:hypothetical protein
MFDIGIALTEDEKNAVWRARYDVYVEELGWTLAGADHGARTVIEPEDENSWVIYATDQGRVVGSYRITRGSDGFSERQVADYGLAPFLAELPAKVLAVGERLARSHRCHGGDLTLALFTGARQIPGWDGVLVVVAAPDAEHLIQPVSFPHGVEPLRGLGRGPGLPACIEQVLLGKHDVRNVSPERDEAG